MPDEFDPQTPSTPPAPEPHASAGVPPPQPYPPQPFPPQPRGPYAAPYAAAGYAPNPYASPYAYPPRKPRSAWFWPIIIFGILLVLGLFCWGIVYVAFHSSDDTTTTTTGFSSDRIAVIDLAGVIIDADKVDTQLRKFGDDSSVKAIILHIDSPGGGAAASQEIYHEVLRIRHEKTKDDHRLGRIRRRLRRLLHRQRLRQDLRQRGLRRRLHRRHHGVDQLRRPLCAGPSSNPSSSTPASSKTPATPPAT